MPDTADLHYIPVYSSAGQRRQALRDRLHVRDQVAGRREDASRFLASGVDMLRHGIECGVSRDVLTDMANALRDAVSDLDGQMRTDLDNAGLYHEWRALDTAELDELRGRIER